MIQSAVISNFKGIKNCNVKGLKPINLFLGKNNSCKSTILEALFYSLKETNSSSIIDVLRRRTNTEFTFKELWYNYDLKQLIETSINSDKFLLSLSLSYDERNKLINKQMTLKNNSNDSNFSSSSTMYNDDLTSSSSLSFGGDFLSILPKNVRPLAEEYFTKSSMIDSSVKNDTRSSEALLGDAKIEGISDELGCYLNRAYGIGTSWEFLPFAKRDNPKKRDYRAAIVVGGKPMYISGLGDGFRYGLQIIGTSLMSKNTGLFIEEVENHQHLGTLKELVSLIIELSAKNNLQYFITSHDYNVWRLFENSLLEDNKRSKLFQPYLVTRNPLDGKVTCDGMTSEDASQFWGKVEKELSSK